MIFLVIFLLPSKYERQEMFFWSDKKIAVILARRDLRLGVVPTWRI